MLDARHGLCARASTGYKLARAIAGTPRAIGDGRAIPTTSCNCAGASAATTARPTRRLPDVVKNWNATHAYPKLVIATTSELFREFEKRYGDKIPVVRGDFTPYWEDGAGSSARETALNRASAERLVQAETLCGHARPATVSRRPSSPTPGAT